MANCDDKELTFMDKYYYPVMKKMASEKRLIDANAFKEQHTYLWDEALGTCECVLVEDIDNAPTVDAVEVVHGRWLYDSNTERYFCSACNEEALYTSKDVPIFDYDWEENLRYSHTETILEEHLTNYCPNCGAKMDGDGNV